MQRVLAQAIDAGVLRWTVRRAQLRRRTLWPDPASLNALRAGAWGPLNFDDPGQPVEVELEPAAVRGRPWLQSLQGRSLRGAPADYTFRFASSEPFARAHDQFVHGDLFLPERDVRGAVVMVPGAFTGAHYGTERGFYARLAQGFNSAGIAAALLDSPLHGRRVASGEISGHDLLHGDLFTYALGIAQAVRDVRSTLGWLSANYGPTGYWGISLGGLVGSLLASHDARPAFAVLLQPPLRRKRGMGSALTRVWREQLVESGVTDDDINSVFGMLRPGPAPVCGAERVLIQASRWDTVSAAAEIERVWEEWGRPAISWWDHGHVSMFLSAEALIFEAVGFGDSQIVRQAQAAAR